MAAKLSPNSASSAREELSESAGPAAMLQSVKKKLARAALPHAAPVAQPEPRARSSHDLPTTQVRSIRGPTS